MNDDEWSLHTADSHQDTLVVDVVMFGNRVANSQRCRVVVPGCVDAVGWAATAVGDLVKVSSPSISLYLVTWTLRMVRVMAVQGGCAHCRRWLSVAKPKFDGDSLPSTLSTDIELKVRQARLR